MLKTGTRQLLWLAGLFLVSRWLLFYFNVHQRFDALGIYWQYISFDSFNHHLLRAVWYDHAQPPVFNLLLGILVKIGGHNTPNFCFVVFHLISLLNIFLIYAITRRVTSSHTTPFIVALIYLLSPSTLILENEIFYTGFVSLLLLIILWQLLKFAETARWSHAAAFTTAITMLCLTRSIYHVAWFIMVALIILAFLRGIRYRMPLILSLSLGFIVVTSWYVKNLLIFGIFSASSWMGMNFARNVFHENEIKDSARIESIEPFSKISAYQRFLDPTLVQRYQGLNDTDLLAEYKNGSAINFNHVGYIAIARLYQKASIHQVIAAPTSFGKNVMQSSLLFFAPATRYSLAEPEAKKIRTYDVLLNFNLSTFAKNLQQRRILTLISAMPMLIFYAIVLFMLFRQYRAERKLDVITAFVLFTIFFVFLLTSLMEHYENMRFRYEVQPLFLIIVAIAVEKRKLASQHPAP